MFSLLIYYRTWSAPRRTTACLPTRRSNDDNSYLAESSFQAQFQLISSSKPLQTLKGFASGFYLLLAKTLNLKGFRVRFNAPM